METSAYQVKGLRKLWAPIFLEFCGWGRNAYAEPKEVAKTLCIIASSLWGTRCVAFGGVSVIMPLPLSPHHSLYVFLKIRNCLFFLSPLNFTLLAVQCGRHIVMSGIPLVIVPMGLKILFALLLRSNMYFS